ncbi:MAG TPA: aspartate aminotransferase family protein [Vicingus sp.]|nr:aspartate aminotransferase family protein [Flavobacteriales bacterium]HRN42257.1 aspartate aminotransferase family protein [Vicingus sp.]
MPTQRSLFLQHVAQTSDFPLCLEIEKAEGMYMTDVDGKTYLDLISGISVSNLGHRHPNVINAVKEQLEKYTYLMVYGEFVQSPQVKLAQLLCSQLPSPLNSCYFVNSGSEANEGAMKLAKRYTGRKEIISFKNAYHGSTQGCLSIIGGNDFKKPFEPLLPNITQIAFNNENDLAKITEKTACVVVEPIMGEAGIIAPQNNFLQKLRARCTETGALLIFDEIQTGFGRTGKLFALEHFGVVPDILTLAKAMGGGFPIGAFVSSNAIMSSLKNNPILGHITTFGGHPVSCAAAFANLHTLLTDKELISSVAQKEQLFKQLLVHPSIKEVRSFGLMLAIEFDSFETNKAIIDKCIEKGVLTDWFLFNDKSLRIAPPLIITNKEIEWACKIILEAI